MANGYFERGEVYWIRMDSGFGFEQGVGRPGVILSCNSQNNASGAVTIAFCSKQQHGTWEVEIEATGCTSYVKVNQINTVDKSRVGKCIGVLNSAEMRELEGVLEDFFDLGYVDETALKAKDAEIADRDVLIGDLKAEMAGAVTEIAKRNEEIASLKMEIEMWQKCYGRCMDMLVDTKVNGDLSRRLAIVEPKIPTPVKQPEPPKEPETPPVVEVEEERLDINRCTATALKKIGFSLAVARKIVEGRPFNSVEDLKRVNGVKASLYRILEPKLCCTEVKKPVVNGGILDPGYETDDSAEVVAEVPKKVNVNTASAKEIHKALGLCDATCYSITGYRKKHGPYEKLEDLLNVANFGKVTLQRYGHLLEV